MSMEYNNKVIKEKVGVKCEFEEGQCGKCEVIRDFGGKCEVDKETGCKCEPDNGKSDIVGKKAAPSIIQPESKYCPDCGTKYYKPYSKYCHHCGKKRV